MPKSKIFNDHYTVYFRDFKKKDEPWPDGTSKQWYKHKCYPTLSAIAEDNKLCYNTAYNILHNKSKKGNKFYRITRIKL